MTFEDELRREREEVSRTTRREAVIKFIAYVKEVHPEFMKEDVIHEVSRIHSECTFEEITSYYQEYIDQQYNQEE